MGGQRTFNVQFTVITVPGAMKAAGQNVTESR